MKCKHEEMTPSVMLAPGIWVKWCKTCGKSFKGFE